MARVMAVQALYGQIISADKERKFHLSQNFTTEADLDIVFKDISSMNNSFDSEGYTASADKKFFKEIFSGVRKNYTDLNLLVSSNLVSSWSSERLDKVVYCVLIIAAYELKHVLETNPAIVINEYIEIAKSFNQNSAFVNGILDEIRKQTRQD